MKLSVASWSFPELALHEVGGLAKTLGFEAVDLGYFGRPALDKTRLLAEPERYGREIAADLPVDIANLFHLFGDDLEERNLSLPPDPQNLADLASALMFARTVGASSVMLLPGMVNPGQSRSEALAASVEALRPMVDAASDLGIAVLVEPHVQGILDSPELAEALVQSVPGLGLVLDPSHFTLLGYRQSEIESLARHAGHAHLRQARPGRLQTRLEDGTLIFNSFFGALQETGYSGFLSIEYEHDAFMNAQFEDVLSETVKMRDCVRSYWAGRRAKGHRRRRP